MRFQRHDREIFDMLEGQARCAHDAARTFYAFTTDFRQISKRLHQLAAIEHEADELTHRFVNKVNTQFLTPIDKEDLLGLTQHLEDVVDTIEATAARIGIYKLPAPRKDLMTLVGLIVAITQELIAVIAALHHGFGNDELAAMVAGVHALENSSDKAFRQAVTDLFADDTIDARLLIKWKEIYERIEKSVNRCEKVASFVESLIAKYA